MSGGANTWTEERRLKVHHDAWTMYLQLVSVTGGDDAGSFPA